jgi:hypothetical protein
MYCIREREDCLAQFETGLHIEMEQKTTDKVPMVSCLILK